MNNMNMETKTPTYSTEQLTEALHKQAKQIEAYKADIQEATSYITELEHEVNRLENLEGMVRNLQHQLTLAQSSRPAVEVSLEDLPGSFGDTDMEKLDTFLAYYNKGLIVKGSSKKTTTRKTTTAKKENG
jgi:predicted  nucleic acid-binding Zn-ribbon protein